MYWSRNSRKFSDAPSYIRTTLGDGAIEVIEMRETLTTQYSFTFEDKIPVSPLVDTAYVSVTYVFYDIIKRETEREPNCKSI